MCICLRGVRRYPLSLPSVFLRSVNQTVWAEILAEILFKVNRKNLALVFKYVLISSVDTSLCQIGIFKLYL